MGLITKVLVGMLCFGCITVIVLFALLAADAIINLFF